MSLKWPWPSFSKRTLPPRTLVTIEVLIAVVVDVREGGRDRDAVAQPDAGGVGDVLEGAVAEVLVEGGLAELVDEVDVGQAVAVDVGRDDAVAVIVMGGLVGLAGVVDDVVRPGDAALRQPVGELEVVEDLEAGEGRGLGVLARLEGRRADVGRRDVDDVAALGGRVGWRDRRLAAQEAAVLVLGDGGRGGPEQAGSEEREGAFHRRVSGAGSRRKRGVYGVARRGEPAPGPRAGRAGGSPSARRPAAAPGGPAARRRRRRPRSSGRPSRRRRARPRWREPAASTGSR